MTNITHLFGGAFTPPKQPQPDPPEVQLARAMEAVGITPPSDIKIDGKLHRFNSGTRGKPGRGDKTGWYCVYPDGVPAGRFGCWRADTDVPFRADVGRPLTTIEQMAHSQRMAEAIKARNEAAAKLQEAVADVAETIWANLAGAPDWHPYLQRKGVKPNGARVTGDGRLALPMYDPDGHLVSLQYIDGDGGKLYHASGKATEAQWIVGDDNGGTIYIAEGFATAATIAEETGNACAIAYSASNLPAVAKSLREKRGSLADIVVVADHDQGGIGFKYADQAAAKFGVRVVRVPIMGMDANDYRAAGHDLKAILLPPTQDGWLLKANALMADQAPPKWIIKGWLEQHALAMVHGPSGAGKSFVVLDWCLHIASRLPEWHGNKVKRHGAVIYLAGEGHYGIKRRLAAWAAHYRPEDINLWVSKTGCDLNTPEGYSRVLEAVRGVGEAPSLIVVDTVHRFMHGDENSAQDVRTMIQAADGLKEEFGCTVILVHHTGVSDEAQHRARGSSAWKGALDVEYSVQAGKPLKIVNKKMKDGQPDHSLYADLVEVVIPGWMDEDGEPVKSVVIMPAEAPADTRKTSRLESHKQLFRKIWEEAGSEGTEGQPYLSRSSALELVMKKLELSENSAKQYLKPSVDNKLIGALTLAEIVEPKGHGWVVKCPAMGGQMNILREAKI